MTVADLVTALDLLIPAIRGSAAASEPHIFNFQRGVAYIRKHKACRATSPELTLPKLKTSVANSILGPAV